MQQRHSIAITFVTDLREAGRAATGPLQPPGDLPEWSEFTKLWRNVNPETHSAELPPIAGDGCGGAQREHTLLICAVFFFTHRGRVTLTAGQVQCDHANTHKRGERKLFTFFFFFCMKGFRGQRWVLTDNAGLIWTIRSQRLRRSPRPCGPVSSVIITFLSHPPPPLRCRGHHDDPNWPNSAALMCLSAEPAHIFNGKEKWVGVLWSPVAWNGKWSLSLTPFPLLLSFQVSTSH